LTLAANGKLEPVGRLSEPGDKPGMSAKPGSRGAYHIKFDRSRIVFDLNGGPDAKHRFLRHVQIGMGGPDMTARWCRVRMSMSLSVRALRLAFENHVPVLTGRRSRHCWRR